MLGHCERRAQCAGSLRRDVCERPTGVHRPPLGGLVRCHVGGLDLFTHVTAVQACGITERRAAVSPVGGQAMPPDRSQRFRSPGRGASRAGRSAPNCSNSVQPVMAKDRPRRLVGGEANATTWCSTSCGTAHRPPRRATRLGPVVGTRHVRPPVLAGVTSPPAARRDRPPGRPHSGRRPAHHRRTPRAPCVASCPTPGITPAPSRALLHTGRNNISVAERGRVL